MAEQSLRELIPDWDRLPLPDVPPPPPVNVARRWLIFLFAPLLVWAGFAGYGISSLAAWRCGTFIGTRIHVPGDMGAGTAAIWWYDAAGQPCRRIITDGGSWGPIVSPDGRHIAYASHAGKPGAAIDGDLGTEGAATVHVADIDGSHQRQLSSDADRPLAWSPDSRKLASCRGVGLGSQIVVTDLSGSETTLPGSQQCIGKATWTGSSLYFVKTHEFSRPSLDEHFWLMSVDVHTGQETTVLDLGRHGLSDYAVTVWNAHHVAVSEVVGARVELHVIDLGSHADHLVARSTAGPKPSVSRFDARFWTSADRLVWEDGGSLNVTAPGGVEPSTRIGGSADRSLVDNPTRSP